MAAGIDFSTCPEHCHVGWLLPFKINPIRGKHGHGWTPDLELSVEFEFPAKYEIRAVIRCKKNEAKTIGKIMAVITNHGEGYCGTLKKEKGNSE